MTLENYKYRTDPFFLRNQFDLKSDGKYRIPIIPKASFSDEDFKDLLLIGFDRIKADDQKLQKRMVHFFLYDYKFEKIWKKPDEALKKLKSYKAVLSPDFSMYLEMNTAIQLYNTFRNRWCGAYLASKGLKVVPTVNWGNTETFDFCFLGIPKGSTVAVSTYMVSEHGNHKDQKEMFLKGYNEMLKRIEPERIICYNTPFPEMTGNIVFVDYELSSWKHQNEDDTTSPFVKYITGELPLPDESDIIIKQGRVMSLIEEKGMGSVYGGEWKPKKSEDERFLGEPGEIKETLVETKKGSYRIKTKIGLDGRAEKERHETDHTRPSVHTNPHDHSIDWLEGFPRLSKPINYFNEEYEFKFYNAREIMSKVIITSENMRFESIADFKISLERGGEIEFEWNDNTFGVFKHIKKAPDSPEQFLIGPSDLTKKQFPGKYVDYYADTIDEILDYVIDGERLRDIVTNLYVTWRNL
ncbi:MAG: DUF4417 domain-containing protein [Clostridia bacterium]|nr:DUF4417 domain-containing protein [Clostridia bacterium]